LHRLSIYSDNSCLFAGVKGNNTVKHSINQFYHQNRRKSINTTILFKANSTRTTATQQILLKNGNLYLYVDGVIKTKTARIKKKKILIGE